MNYYINALKKYAVFTGRSRRKEYWFFILFNLIIYLILDILVNVTKSEIFGIIYILYALGVLIPSIAVAVRRLHDTNRSGWWYLINLIPLVGAIIFIVFMATDGQVGDNQYGSDPKVAPQA